MSSFISRVRAQGFTLIELLIVIAIIAILALIAIPNFLEAQTRSKVARAKADERTMVVAIEAYFVDNNEMFPDGNDPNVDLSGLTFETETGIKSDAVDNGISAPYRQGLLRTYHRVRFLTTPIAYITSIPIDAFSKVLPYGYETWWDFTNKRPYFCLITSLGPDRDLDSGYGSSNSVYDPSNGSISNGDIFRTAAVSNRYWVTYYFGGDFKIE